jgi:hypothetical protein
MNNTQSELRRRLDNERRSAPIDLRGRIGPSSGAGNRRGRVIEWRRSEQRAVELLEGLCARMAADYRIVPLEEGLEEGDEGGPKVWRRWRGEGRAEGVGAPPGGDTSPARETEVKALAAGCSMLLEEVEEDLVAALRKGAAAGGEEQGQGEAEEDGEEEEGEEGPRPQALDAARLLCRELTRRCEGKEAHEAAKAAAEKAVDAAANEGPAPAAAASNAESDDDDDEQSGGGGGGAQGGRDGTEL